jgi:flagellar basal-body rod protein FlgF
MGAGLLRVNEGVNIKGVDSIRVRRGFVEMSNVNPTTEMLKMIETMRHFEANSQSIKVHDGIIGYAISRIGEF